MTSPELLRACSLCFVLLGLGYAAPARAVDPPQQLLDEDTTRSHPLSYSPDHQLVVLELQTHSYLLKMGNREFTASSVLVLKPAVDSDCGLLLGQYKFFDVFWSPDSKFVAVFKGYLTHNTDVDVYRVENANGPSVRLSLIFRRDALSLPEGKSWTNWEFKRWELEKDVLVIEEIDENHPHNTSYRPPDKPSLIEVPLSAKPIKTLSMDEGPERGRLEGAGK